MTLLKVIKTTFIVIRLILRGGRDRRRGGGRGMQGDKEGGKEKGAGEKERGMESWTDFIPHENTWLL